MDPHQDENIQNNNKKIGVEHIKTVVVLVQENRSFDHILGWMKSINPEIDGVTGQESNPLSTTDLGLGRIFFGDNSVYVDPDPGHSIQDIYEQVFGQPWSINNPDKLPPTMNGFAQNAERLKPGLAETVMNGFKPEHVAVYKELVSEFAVCDRWFASIPASTQPNRAYIHSATSHGATGNDKNMLIHGFPQKTIFDSLHEANLTFGIYYQFPPATLFYRNLRKLKYLKNFHEFGLHFKKHCREGKLPNYVVIEQRFWDLPGLPGNDDHPSHDVFEGQKLVKEVYEAVRSSPQWNQILFVITYDEHGGFYDHVPTPVVGVPSPDGIVGPEPYNFKFDRLGVRVPTIFISPWIERGTIVHEPSGPTPTSQFEHSSIAATVKKIFNLKSFLTKRDEWAGTFDVVLTRTTPRTDCPEVLSEPKKLRPGDEKEDAKLNDLQEMLVQMGAALNGDHRKDIYPDKLVENMTVSQGFTYVQDAFKMFCDECQKATEAGVDDDQIILLSNTQASTSASASTTATARRTWRHKLLSCILCD